MSYQCILTETQGRVGRITLNRPKQLNALSPTLMQELGAALLGFDADDGVGAIVITGNEKAFAAGADIGAISPEEIALSILAEITAIRRKKLRTDYSPAAEKAPA